VASIGLAPNKFLAKVGSDLGKPDGFVMVALGQERAFLDPLPISRLWGVGPKTEARLHQMGFQTIGQIARTPLTTLDDTLGQGGRDLWELANGLDDRPVEPEQEAKSIGAEHTFAEDTADREQIRRTILELADRVGGRLRRDEVLAGGVTLKFRDHRFHTVTRAASLDQPTDVGDTLFREAWALLDKVEWQGNQVRLVGVTATRLRPAAAPPEGQLPLFPGRPDPRRNLAHTVDKIRERFGGEAITRASLLAGDREARAVSHEPRATSGEPGKESRELKRKREPRAESREPRAESRGTRAKS